jgi:hypothetical protein
MPVIHPVKTVDHRPYCRLIGILAAYIEFYRV